MRLSLTQGASQSGGSGETAALWDCGWLVPKPEGMDLGATIARDPTKGLRATLPAQEPMAFGHPQGRMSLPGTPR